MAIEWGQNGYKLTPCRASIGVDPEEPRVPFAGRFTLPRRFSVKLRDTRYPVRLDFEVRDGRPECTSIAMLSGKHRLERGILRDDPWPPLTGQMLRRIPLDTIAKEATVLLSYDADGEQAFLEGPRLRRDRVDTLEEAYRGRGQKRRGAHRGVRLTDDDLAEHVRLYREAVNRKMPPHKFIAKRMHVSESTSNRRTSIARERGLLGAPKGPTAGERGT